MDVRVALIMGVLATPGATWAAPPSISDLVARLSDYEAVPDAHAFVEGGEATASALWRVFQSDSQPTFVRVRVLRLIGFFPPEVAAPLLQQVVRNANAKPVFLREAVGALVRCGGARAISELAPLLQRPDPSVRRAAIEGLAQIGNLESNALLAAHRAREADPAVRAALEQALASDSAN